MVFRELFFNSFYREECGGIERTDFLVSTLGGCDGLERTYF